MCIIQSIGAAHVPGMCHSEDASRDVSFCWPDTEPAFEDTALRVVFEVSRATQVVAVMVVGSWVLLREWMCRRGKPMQVVPRQVPPDEKTVG